MQAGRPAPTDSARRHPISLHPSLLSEIPTETMRVARTACPHGTVITRLRDESAEPYRDEDFAALYWRRGQPGLAHGGWHW